MHTDFVYVYFSGFLFKIAPTLGVSPWNSLQVHCVTVSLAQLDPIIDTRELYGSHFYSRCGVKWNLLLLYSNATKNEKCRARERSEKFIIESKSPNQNRDLIGKKSRISMENNDFNQLFLSLLFPFYDMPELSFTGTGVNFIYPRRL